MRWERTMFTNNHSDYCDHCNDHSGVGRCKICLAIRIISFDIFVAFSACLNEETYWFTRNTQVIIRKFKELWAFWYVNKVTSLLQSWYALKGLLSNLFPFVFRCSCGVGVAGHGLLDRVDWVDTMTDWN